MVKKSEVQKHHVIEEHWASETDDNFLLFLDWKIISSEEMMQ